MWRNFCKTIKFDAGRLSGPLLIGVFLFPGCFLSYDMGNDAGHVTDGVWGAEDDSSVHTETGKDSYQDTDPGT